MIIQYARTTLMVDRHFVTDAFGHERVQTKWM